MTNPYTITDAAAPKSGAAYNEPSRLSGGLLRIRKVADKPLSTRSAPLAAGEGLGRGEIERQAFAESSTVRANAKEPAMWRWMMIAAAACCIGLPAVQAQAGYPDDRLIVAQRDRERDAQRRDNRRGDQRERRREADRQQRESLTPDEHRDLNRDLERANREIYRKGRDRR